MKDRAKEKTQIKATELKDSTDFGKGGSLVSYSHKEKQVIKNKCMAST